MAMRNKVLAVFLVQFHLVALVTCHAGSSHQDATNWPFNLLKSWVRLLNPIWKPSEPRVDFKHLKTEAPVLVSSISDSSEEDFNQLVQLSGLRSGCACEIGTASSCYTQCVSVESRCGRTCLHVTQHSVTVTKVPAAKKRDDSPQNVFSTFHATTSSGCDLVSTACFVSTALGAAIALGAGVAAGVLAFTNAQQSNNADRQLETQLGQSVEQFLAAGGLVNTQIPSNDQTIPVGGAGFRNDGGCGDNLVAFPDGHCYPVLRRGPCSDPFRWVTVDPETLAGRCSPRLCASGRVFVGRDGLCHDADDPLECRGGRRLFYSAYGDPLCDCPVGQYPFPSERDDCVPLFTRGPCRDGQVVGFGIAGALACVPADCPSSSGEQLVRNERGECLPIGSPCSSPTQFYGYDVFLRRGVCADVTDQDSPYFSDFDESYYNQNYPEYDDYRLIFIRPRDQDDIGRKQDSLDSLFRFPTSAPDTLLNPCRPGERNGNNFKCTNPLVSRRRRLELFQAVRSAYRCPADKSLQANGFCTADTSSASCGPSYRFVRATGQCRQIFQL